MIHRYASEPVRDAPAVLSRQRIVAEIDALARQIIWIASPAGSGKTHLLRQIAAEQTGIVIEVELENSDTDPGSLFAKLTKAVRSSTSDELDLQFRVNDVGQLRRFSLQLFDTCARLHAENVLLLVDDMHLLANAEDILDALRYAIERMPSGMKLILTSRESPQATWMHLVASGRMAVTRPDMLVMNTQEVRALLSAHTDWPHGQTDELVSGLMDATSGWALGLGLLIELGKQRKSPIHISEAHSHVIELFSAQVLDLFSPREQEMLVQLAPYEKLYPSIIRKQFGMECLSVIERLYRSKLLVVRASSMNESADRPYLLHGLLRNCLRERARTGFDPHTMRQQCARMAGALIQVGDIEGARELWIQISDWSSLLRYLEEHAESLYFGGRIRTLLRCLEAIPVTLRDGTEHLGFWLGLCLLHVDPTRSRIALENAYSRYIALDNHKWTVRAWAAVVDSIWFEWDDCKLMDRFISDLPTLQGRVMTLPPGSAVRIEHERLLAQGAFAALSIRDPARHDFLQWEARNMALFLGHSPRSERIVRGLQLLFYHVYGSGDHARASSVRMRLRQLHEEATESAADHCAYWVAQVAYSFWFAEDTSDAQTLAMNGLAVTESLAQQYWDIPLLNAALFRVAADEAIEELSTLLSILEERLGAESRENDLAIAQHFQAYVAWLDGQHESALVAIDAACDMAHRNGFAISPLYYGLGKVAILAATGRTDLALPLLGALRRRARAQHGLCVAFVADMIGAGIALRKGHHTLAGKYLRRALHVGEMQGYRTVLWLRLKDRRRLCELAISQQLCTEYARQLQRVCSVTTVDGSVTSQNDKVECLTLGRADVRIAGRSQLSSRKPQMLVLLLMLQLVAAGEAGITTDALIDAVWPDADRRSARARLKTTLHRLRKLFVVAGSIVSSGGRVRIDPQFVDVDAWALERLALSTNLRKSEPAELAWEAMRLYQGAFVDLYSGELHLLSYRELLTSAYRGLVQSGASHLANAGRVHDAAVLLQSVEESEESIV